MSFYAGFAKIRQYGMVFLLKIPTARVPSLYAYNLCRASIALSKHAVQDAKLLADIAHAHNSHSQFRQSIVLSTELSYLSS